MDISKTPAACGTSGVNTNCKTLLINTQSNVCLKCPSSNSGGVWYVDDTNKGIPCGDAPPGGVPSNLASVGISELTYARTTLARPCEYKEENDGSGTCTSCDSSCGGSCTGTTASSCDTCSWFDYSTLDGPASNTCSSTCSAANFRAGFCTTCTTTGGCATCSGGLCSTCSAGDPDLGICCDSVTGPFYIGESGGLPTCLACHASCTTCDGPGEMNCRTCVSGGAIQSNGICAPPPCPTGQYHDYVASQCTTCPTGCATCSSASLCDSCDPTYALDSATNLCVTCPAPGKYVNTDNNPATCETCDLPGGNFINTNNSPNTCDSCPGTCSTCNSLTDCTTCKTNNYLFANNLCNTCDDTNGFRKDLTVSPQTCHPCSTDCLECNASQCTKCAATKGFDSSSGNCLPCTGTQFLNTGNSPSTCDNCPTGCTSCTSDSSCGGCLSGYYLDGICHACSTSNGFFIDSSGTPESCESCSTGCKICSDASTCTTCFTNYVPNGGGCDLCQVSNGQFWDGGTTCTDCLQDCKECLSLTSCLLCQPGFYVKDTLGVISCEPCDIGNGKFINFGSPQSCDDCHESCLTCSGTQHDCLTCQQGLIQITTEEKNQIRKEKILQ